MANPGERVRDATFTEDSLIVDLADGRSISVPLAWFPRLLYATSKERENWEIAGAGYGLHWPAHAAVHQSSDHNDCISISRSLRPE
jgi:hypothetical protein